MISQQKPLICVEKLKKIYHLGSESIEVLKGVDLTINSQEFVSITGTSGSGKSTLMHLIGCLDKPTSGDIYLDGVHINEASSNDLAMIRNQKIGFIFQKFNLLPDMTAQDNVALPCLYAGIPEAKARSRAAEILEKVSLQDRLNHYPYQLSGGQQQRVAIARSIVNNPKILFGDEPTGNLDTKTGDSIMNIFDTLNQEGISIVMVTHEPEIAARTKRVIKLSDGLLVSDNNN